MGQLVAAIGGIGEACLALDMPIVSGNVSLYNETRGKAILPTPTIGGVGLIDDWSKSVGIGSANAGDVCVSDRHRSLPFGAILLSAYAV